MMYASAERRLVDKWARIGKGVTEEFILNERIVKKNLKRSEIQYKKYRQQLQWTLVTVIVTSAVYML